MATDFPAGLIPSAVLFDIENVSRSGGVSTNGMEQVVGSGVGRWTARLADIRIRTNAQILTWRAFKHGLRGRAGTILVSPYDGKRTNWPVDEYGRVLHPGFTRRRQLDGTIYEDPEIPTASQVNATFAANAAARATTVQITVAQGSAIKAGQYFSPSAGRLHVVTAVLSATSFSIEPPLRQAVSLGQAVNFTRPTCEMRLASDDSGSLDIQIARFGIVSLDLVEAI